MSARCDPAKLLILGAGMIEHFQLPQCWINSLSGAVSPPDGRFIGSLTVTDHAEFNKSRFMRLSSGSFSDLEESQLEALKDLCHAAHPSEEFFVTDATNQWLRTAIKPNRAHADLFSPTLTEDEPQGPPDIHSNVLPYDPYWTKPPPVRDGSSRRVHIIPCCIFREVIQEGNTLIRKLQEWTQESGSREKCDIGNHVQLPASKKVWEINPRAIDSTKNIKVRHEPNGAQVSQVTWRGGNFIEKEIMNPEEFAAEVNAIDKLCHPHIVYIFGRFSCIDEQQGSLYMERMNSDLLTLIIDKNRGNTGPPFLHHDSVDILLQIAKAMAHMHERKVIHGDLKSLNILVSPFKISERQNRYHYLAKVADFGGARVKDSKPFKPSLGTTAYAAPEVLKFRKNQTGVIPVPENIDIYSFGLVAFEVLTGKSMTHVFENMFPMQLPRSEVQGSVLQRVKDGVIDGTLKPPLRKECEKDNFLRDERLILLIESCWLGESERPSFTKIVEVLNGVRLNLEPTSQSDIDPPRHARLVDDDNSDAPEEAASRSNGHHQTSSDQAGNTSVASHGQVSGPPQHNKNRRTLLKRLLLSFSCVSGGKVQY